MSEPVNTMEEGQEDSQSPELDQKTAGAVTLLIGRIAAILGILAGLAAPRPRSLYRART